MPQPPIDFPLEEVREFAKKARTVGQFARRFKCSYPTAAAKVRALWRRGVLVAVNPGQKPTWYRASRNGGPICEMCGLLRVKGECGCTRKVTSGASAAARGARRSAP